MMTWRRPGEKPLSEPMMVSFPTHGRVTRPQRVNSHRLDCACCVISQNSVTLKQKQYIFIAVVYIVMRMIVWGWVILFNAEHQFHCMDVFENGILFFVYWC